MLRTTAFRLLAIPVLVAVASIASTAQQTERTESTPAKAEGLESVIQISKREFQVNEPLSLLLTFRNDTTTTLWVPAWRGYGLSVTPHLKNVSTGAVLSGGDNLGGGGVLPSRLESPIGIKPGEHLSLMLEFSNYGYVQGDKDFDTATNELFKAGEVRPSPVPIPAGDYLLSVEISIRSWYRGTMAKEKDPVPLWRGDILRSNPVRITIRDPGDQPRVPPSR